MTSAPVTIPSGIGAISPAWLSDALGAVVTDVAAERIAEDSGFSALVYRLHLTGDDALPPTVIAKLPADSEARGAMDMLGGYRRELTFYSQVAGRGMDTPQVYLAIIDDNGVDFVLLLEDLGSWDNADHLAGLSLDRAELAIDALAGLHSWSVQPSNSTVLQLFPAMDMPIVRDLLVNVFAPGWEIYREHTTSSVPPRVASFAERFGQCAPAALTALTERAMLLHGDIRADNMFFAGDRLKVVDFQFACRGCGPADIAYLVSQGLPSDIRRGRDDVLLRSYLAALTGVDYPFDEAWRHYRMAVAYLLLMPVVSLLGWDSLPPRARSLCLTLTDRAVAAIDDIDAVEEFT